jgi:hypothetical protein
MKWTKEKPNFPCVLLSRAKINGEWLYNSWRFEIVKDSGKSYLGWCTNNGARYGDINDMRADGYSIVERL